MTKVNTLNSFNPFENCPTTDSNQIPKKLSVTRKSKKKIKTKKSTFLWVAICGADWATKIDGIFALN